MRLSLFLTPEYPAGMDLRPRMKEHVRQAKLAADMGFIGVAAGQHLSVNDLQWAPPLPFLSYIASAVPGIDISLAAILVPYFNPVLLAESLAFLDVITEGRLTIGAAPGWAEGEFKALGKHKAERVNEFKRNMKIIDALLRGEEVEVATDDGRTTRFTLGLLPVQTPRPQFQLGSSGAKTARDLAPLTDTMVLSAHIPLERQIPIQQGYLEGKGVSRDQIPPMAVIRNVFVAETREEAIRVAIPYITESYSHFGDWGLFAKVLHEDTSSKDFERVVLDRVIIGDPDDVANALRKQSARLGTDRFHLRMQYRGMPSEHVERSIELLGRRVLPQL